MPQALELLSVLSVVRLNEWDCNAICGVKMREASMRRKNGPPCSYREALSKYYQALQAYEQRVLSGSVHSIRDEVLHDVSEIAIEAILLKMKLFQRFEGLHELDS